MHASDDHIRLLKEGGEGSFKIIFQHYYRPLTLFALKYVGDVEEAKEIVQEFFIRLWARRDALDVKFSLKTYVYRGVRNACLNYLETNRVLQQHLRGYEEPTYTNDNALENMLVAEQEEMLMQAIDRLPTKCRQIFVLSRMHKLSNQHVAEQLQISVKTVEAQITIALKRLRELLITFAATVMAWLFA